MASVIYGPVRFITGLQLGFMLCCLPHGHQSFMVLFDSSRVTASIYIMLSPPHGHQSFMVLFDSSRVTTTIYIVLSPPHGHQSFMVLFDSSRITTTIYIMLSPPHGHQSFMVLFDSSFNHYLTHVTCLVSGRLCCVLNFPAVKQSP